jgi:hypothetical protein
MNALTPSQQLIEVEFTELDALLIKENPEIMNSTTLRIYNPNWIIYPPGNRMPTQHFFTKYLGQSKSLRNSKH